jgi:hypothetical protein
VGAIAEAVRRYVPATYNEMLIAPGAGERLFATSDLQALAHYVEYRLFATVISEADETVLFNPAQTQFLGKLTTLQFIPAAVDFWDSRLASVVSTGTGEVVNYRDHRDGLLKLWEILNREVLQDARIFGFNLKKSGLLPRVTYGDNGREILVTPDPEKFPKRFQVQRPWLETPWRTVV